MNKLKNYKSKRPAKYFVSFYASQNDSAFLGNLVYRVYGRFDLTKVSSRVFEVEKAKGVNLTSVIVTSITKL